MYEIEYSNTLLTHATDNVEYGCSELRAREIVNLIFYANGMHGEGPDILCIQELTNGVNGDGKTEFLRLMTDFNYGHVDHGELVRQF